MPLVAPMMQMVLYAKWFAVDSEGTSNFTKVDLRKRQEDGLVLASSLPGSYMRPGFGQRVSLLD